MPRFNVESDGKWACFSTISDTFITPFVTLEEHEKWRDEEYGRQKEPLETANKMSLGQALRSLSANHSDEGVLANLREAKLIDNIDEFNQNYDWVVNIGDITVVSVVGLQAINGRVSSIECQMKYREQIITGHIILDSPSKFSISIPEIGYLYGAKE